MDGLLQLATNLPIIFGLVVMLAVFLFSMASFMLGMALPAGIYRPHIGQILGRLISTLAFFLVLLDFGWFSAAGFTWSIGEKIWLPILLCLIYAIAAADYAYFGDFRFQISKPKLAAMVTLSQMTVGLVEETAFRGIVMYAFIRIWGDSTWGLVASVLLSALFFGASHMVWVAFGKPPLQAALTSLTAFESGIYWGAFVVISGSIWLAVIFHGLVNAVVNMRLIDKPDYKETVSAGVRMALLNLPIVIFGVIVLILTPPESIIPIAP